VSTQLCSTVHRTSRSRARASKELHSSVSTLALAALFLGAAAVTQQLILAYTHTAQCTEGELPRSLINPCATLFPGAAAGTVQLDGVTHSPCSHVVHDKETSRSHPRASEELKRSQCYHMQQLAQCSWTGRTTSQTAQPADTGKSCAGAFRQLGLYPRATGDAPKCSSWRKTAGQDDTFSHSTS
jgi:hypothetical protein